MIVVHHSTKIHCPNELNHVL